MRYIITLTVLLLFVGCGSYFYAEPYKIHCSEIDFVRKVDSLKSVHPEYKWNVRAPNGAYVDSDGPSTPFSSIGEGNLMHYDFTFYIPTENKLFQCHIVPYDTLNSKDEFTLRFTSVSDTNYSENYNLNSDKSTCEKDAEYQHLFEELILEKLNVNWGK